MSDSKADDLQQRMAGIRECLHRDVEGIKHDARVLTDWRHYVRAYPWLCCGAAAALGFLVVPRRLETIRPDADTLAELAKQERLVVQPKVQAQAEQRSGTGSLLGWATGFMLRTGLSLLGQQLAQRFQQRAAETSVPPSERFAHNGPGGSRRPR